MVEVNDGEEINENEDAPKPAPQSRFGGIWMVAGIVAVALCCGGFLLKAAIGGPREDLEGDAKHSCETAFIADRLKAPADAEYSGETVSHLGDVYTVTGIVDAPNGFGTKLRMRFSCVVRSSGDQWLLQSASVG